MEEAGDGATAEGADEQPPDPGLGKCFTAALELAVELHRGQACKGTPIPYLGRILGIAALVIEDERPVANPLGALARFTGMLDTRTYQNT